MFYGFSTNVIQKDAEMFCNTFPGSWDAIKLLRCDQTLLCYNTFHPDDSWQALSYIINFILWGPKKYI